MVKKQEKKMTDVLVKKTHFSSLEIEKLFQLYREHSADLDSMDRNTFREFLHDIFNMTDDILMDRIFKFFDTVNDGNITREEWIMGHNVFLKGKIIISVLYTNQIIASLIHIFHIKVFLSRNIYDIYDSSFCLIMTL